MLGRRRFGALIALLLGALLLSVAFATQASAKTYVVNSLADTNEAEACEGLDPCTLRSAIELSNSTNGSDTIEFVVAGTIHLEGSTLPAIDEALTIDGTTAPGYAGAPVVGIDGTEGFSEGEADGLQIFTGPVTIDGLEIGNFSDTGIAIESEDPVRLCGDYIGTDISGKQAAPNLVGVLVSEFASGARIGAGCPAGSGNLISGNSRFGILDHGEETEIAANRIGLAASGAPLGNGGFENEGPPEGGGIFVASGANDTVVGPGPGEAGNTIAFNEIAGILVSTEALRVAIGGNSIHSNVGPGIEYEAERRPEIPVLSGAEAKPAETVVTGALKGAASTEYLVEFFANQACDENGSGEGQTPIGDLEVTAAADGAVAISAHGLDPIPAGQTVITATATAANGSTSEFSKCLTATVIPPEVKPPPSGPPEVNGRSVAVAPAVGTILIKLPGEKKFHPLKAGEIIPVGTIVDATNGRVTLTSIDDEGHEQTAVFYGGRFQVFQQPGSTLVVLRLRGDGTGTGACQGGVSGRASATISGRRGRHLWGSGHGSFRTEGAHGSATVRGTIWFTEDRCDGTFFKTKRGVVTIRDFAKHKTVSLPAGQEYLAAAP